MSFVRQLVGACERRGVQSDVVTLDPTADSRLADAGTRVFALGPSHGRYRFCRRLAPWLERNAGGYDAVVAHGIWQYQSAAVARWARRTDGAYFVFVHGALDPWFQRQYPLKHAKKALYWSAVERRVLGDASAVFFGLAEEMHRAQLSFTRHSRNEEVVPMGVAAPDGESASLREAFLKDRMHLRDKRILLFLGRLHPVKGCDILIDAFSLVRETDDRLHLVLAGPDEDGWADSLVRQSRRRGVSDCVTWSGMLTSDERWGACLAAEALILPSHFESFGMVVPEALACGLPVLLSDKVCLWREVSEAGAGLVREDTVTGVADLIATWLKMPQDEKESMRVRACQCFVDRFDIRRTADVFLDALERRTEGRLSRQSRPSRA